AAFSGLTAAWLHGLDVEPCSPIEITIPSPTTSSTRAGMRVRRRKMHESEVVKVGDLCATSVLRTLRDLCSKQSLTEGVVLVDMALHKRLIAAEVLLGTRALRKAVAHSDPASESPMETRLRMLLVCSGLPRPEAQVNIGNVDSFAGRVDLYYRANRLGLEYDGGTHRDALVQDNRRQNLLINAGIRVLRFTAGDIYNRPDVVVRQVRAALAS
ncbi:MAG TPA: DUF559 domain-containing protein, partial [Candidatus Dormibacteraeota bacterium]